MNSKIKFSTLCVAAALAGATPSAMAQTLTHRYSFNDPSGSVTLTDSVGGSAWDGYVYVDSLFPDGAYLDGSQLQLLGQGGYGILPAGLVSGETAVTIEFWASFGTNAAWSRVWAFGNQSAGSQDTGIDYCHYASGNYQNLNFKGAGYVNNAGGLNSAQNVHVTAVIDPANNQMLYYNGTTVRSGSLNGGPLQPLNTIVDDYGLLGRSLYDADPTLNGSIDEFRIYSGVLTKAQVILNDAVGPDNYFTTPGALLSLELQSPSGTILPNEKSTQIFKGNFENVTGLDLIAYGGATFQSQNTSVLTVSSAGVVTGVAPGTTGVIASYGGQSVTNQITVVVVPATLQHRYSFTADASDSVGGADGTLQGGAAVSGGKVVLSGGASGQYVDLPGPAINIGTNRAVTIQAWVDFKAIGNFSRLWNFGRKNGTGAADEVYLQPRSYQAQHRVLQNLASGSQTLTWPGSLTNWSGQITTVIDPGTGTLALYRNGVLEYALYNATAPLSLVSNELAVLGRSLVDSDPYLAASIDEFRIYNGALSPQEIARSYAAGPDTAAWDPGALQSIELSPVVYPANANQMPPVILANYANLTGFNLLPNSAARAPGLMLTSSDTNVIRVLANNFIQTFGPGQATLSATYQGKTAGALVQVGNKAVLTHRYSFAANVNDSVGTANGTLQGAASVSGGKLVLDGTAGTSLALPPKLLQGYDAVTIDTWVDLGAGANWARLWNFCGNTNNGNIGDEFYLAPRISASTHRYSTGFSHDAITRDLGPVWQSQTLHITAIFGNGTFAVYTNGVLHDVATTAGRPDQIGVWQSWIGKSPYTADPYFKGSVDEFRVYNGRLSPREIWASQVLGPDAPLSVAPPMLAATVTGGSVTLKWPIAAAGFTVQAKSNLATGSWTIVTNAPTLVGSQWQLTLPAASAGQYFRLWR